MRPNNLLSRPGTERAFRRGAAALGLLAAALGAPGCEVMSGPTRAQQAQMRVEDHLVTADQLVAEGRIEEALARLTQAIAENPTLTVAHIGMADIYRQQGDYRSAELGYRRAVEIEPGNFTAQYNHGLMLQLLDRLTDSVRAYLRALSIRPGDFDANLNLATAYLQLNEARQALPYARRAVAIDPRNGAARINLGAVYAALERHNDAVLEYQSAAELMDLTPPLLLNMADSLGKAGRHQEMINTLDRLLKIEPSAQAHERMGFAHFRMKRYDLAMESFGRALDEDADHFPALNGVGVCLLNQYLLSGRSDTAAKDEAIRALRRSVRINRNQPRIVELISRYG